MSFSVLGVPIEHGITVPAGQRQSLPELLHNPIAGWMCGAVEMQNSSPPVFDDEEAIKCLKRQRRDREEIERDDDLAMVVQEGEPPFCLAPVRAALQAVEVSRNSRFGNLESELEQFAMNTRRAPCWIIGLHTLDQFTNFFV